MARIEQTQDWSDAVFEAERLLRESACAGMPADEGLASATRKLGGVFDAEVIEAALRNYRTNSALVEEAVAHSKTQFSPVRHTPAGAGRR